MSPTYDVFSLGADAEYDGDWQGVEILKARAGIGTSLSFDAQASLCHGIDLGLTGSLTAHANAMFAMILSASGEVRGVASAGVSARAILAPDPFEEFGLALDVGAWAEASAAARIAIGLDTGQIIALAGTRVDGLALELFTAFLDEVRVEVGVWGIAAASANARAHLSCSGQMRDDGNAGFTFEMGAAAGLGLGAGWDFYGGAKIDDPGRLAASAARLISAELVNEARKRLGPDAQIGIELLDLALPIVLRCCQELGAAAAAGLAGRRSRLLDTFIDVAEHELRAWAMRRLTALAEQLVADAVDMFTDWIVDAELEDAQHDEIRAKLQEARALVPGDDNSFTIDIAVQLMSPLIDVAQIVLGDEVSAIRRPLTILWLSLASAEALWDSASYGEEGLDVALPEPPQAVIDELTAAGALAPQTLRISDAVGYIADTQLLPIIADYLPEVGEVFNLLDQSLGLGSDAIVEVLLRGVSGGSLATTGMYTKLRGMLADALERLINDELLPQLAAALPGNDSRIRFVSDVANPAMVAFARLMLAELDDVAAGNIDGAFDGAFQTGLGSIVAKLVGGSAVVLTDVIFDYTLTALQGGLSELHDRVANGDVDLMVDALAARLGAARLIPPGVTASRTALRELLTELIQAARRGSGVLVWTPKRRIDLRNLLLDAFADFDGPKSDADHDELKQFFIGVLDCNFIPHPAELLDAGVLVAEIAADTAVYTIPPAMQALERFTLTLTIAVVEQIDLAAREFFDNLGRAIDDLIRELNALRVSIEETIALADQALRDALELTAGIAHRLRNASFRAAILAQANADAEKAVVDGVKATFGFDALPQEGKDAAIAAALFTFHVAWNAVDGLLNLAIKVAARVVADTIDAVVSAADSSQDALDTLRNDLDQAIGNELAARGILIPEISGAALAKIAKDLLLTDELLTLLNQALDFLDDARTKRQLADDLEQERVLKEGELAADQGRNRIQDIRNLSITILSPVPFQAEPERAWKYGSRVPIALRVKNGFLAMLDEPQRLLVALNGRPVSAPSTSAQAQRDLRIDFDLRAGQHPLIAGINVLECTILDGRGGILRATVAFACDPSVEVIGGLEVDAEASVFDTSHNDHDETAVELVTFFNGSANDIGLGGWRMFDRAGHVFAFPARTLLTGQRVSVHTGSGRDTDTDFFWERPQAIWNNRGDTVALVDVESVLQLTYSYGRMAR